MSFNAPAVDFVKLEGPDGTTWVICPLWFLVAHPEKALEALRLASPPVDLTTCKLYFNDRLIEQPHWLQR